jgi:phosphoesterase RecJ-like protein
MTTAETSSDIRQACEAIVERIRSGNRFLITSHRNPDGDAIGSALALRGLLRNLGKSAEVIVRDNFHPGLRRTPGADSVQIVDNLPADYPNGYDALFTMECPEHERTGYPVLPGPVINVDHHLGNTMYGEINYLDIEAPSVGEMILQLNKLLGAPMDADIATAMYVSLSTDTGFFRYTNTTLRTFEAAVEMVKAGANPGEISLWINESNSAASVKLLGLCLNSMRMYAGGKVATLELPKRFLVEAGANSEDAEGVVNYARAIEGVLVGAMFKEANDGTRVSMRAKPGVDVQAVAAMFGGGGHKAASGCFVPLPLDEAREKIVSLLQEIV